MNEVLSPSPTASRYPHKRYLGLKGLCIEVGTLAANVHDIDVWVLEPSGYVLSVLCIPI